MDTRDFDPKRVKSEPPDKDEASGYSDETDMSEDEGDYDSGSDTENDREHVTVKLEPHDPDADNDGLPIYFEQRQSTVMDSGESVSSNVQLPFPGLAFPHTHGQGIGKSENTFTAADSENNTTDMEGDGVNNASTSTNLGLIFPSSSSSTASLLDSSLELSASILDPAALLSLYTSKSPSQTGKNEYHCDECNKVFPFMSLLRRHKDRHLNIRPYPCDLCDKAFFNPGDMKKHRLIHTGEKPHICEVCNKAFTEISHLNAHMMIHTGARPHICPICGKAFNRSSTMKKHVACVHFDQKPYECDICNKRFNQRSNLWKHQLIHTGEKNHVCEICQKAFTQIGHLQRHKKVHTSPKPRGRNKEQICDLCNQQFTTYIEKKKHIRSVHAKERAFLCLECGKGFGDASALRNHTRVHTGEKNYICEVCKKAFTKLNTLKYHKTTHTGQKPFPCDLCKMSFMWAGHLDKHRRLIHHVQADPSSQNKAPHHAVNSHPTGAANPSDSKAVANISSHITQHPLPAKSATSNPFQNKPTNISSHSKPSSHPKRMHRPSEGQPAQIKFVKDHQTGHFHKRTQEKSGCGTANTGSMKRGPLNDNTERREHVNVYGSHNNAPRAVEKLAAEIVQAVDS